MDSHTNELERMTSQDTPDRLESCRLCLKRSFSLEDGVLCGLTGAKPAFEGECPDFEFDVEERDRLENQRKREMDSFRLTGFPAFYLYFALPLGMIFTLISFIGNFRFASYGGNPFLLGFDVVNLLFYLYFGVYTIYAFKTRRPDAVYVAKFQLIILFLTNLLVLLVTGGEPDSVLNNGFRLVTSLIWAIVFFISLSVSDDIKYLIPKETRKLSDLNRTMIILSIAVPLLLLFFGVMAL